MDGYGYVNLDLRCPAPLYNFDLYTQHADDDDDDDDDEIAPDAKISFFSVLWSPPL